MAQGGDITHGNGRGEDKTAEIRSGWEEDVGDFGIWHGMLWRCIVMSPSIHFLFSKNISFVESVSSLSFSLQRRSGWTFIIVIGWTVDHCHNVNRALGDSSKGGVVTLLRRRREHLRQDLSRRMGTRYCASYRVWLPGEGAVGMIQFYILTHWWTNMAMERSTIFLWENPRFRLGHVQLLC